VACLRGTAETTKTAANEYQENLPKANATRRTDIRRDRIAGPTLSIVPERRRTRKHCPRQTSSGCSRGRPEMVSNKYGRGKRHATMRLEGRKDKILILLVGCLVAPPP
jgi:hypothetical protein